MANEVRDVQWARPVVFTTPLKPCKQAFIGCTENHFNICDSSMALNVSVVTGIVSTIRGKVVHGTDAALNGLPKSIVHEVRDVQCAHPVVFTTPLKPCEQLQRLSTSPQVLSALMVMH